MNKIETIGDNAILVWESVLVVLSTLGILSLLRVLHIDPLWCCLPCCVIVLIPAFRLCLSCWKAKARGQSMLEYYQQKIGEMQEKVKNG